MRIKLLLLAILFSVVSWGQVITETFDDATTVLTTGGIGMPSAYSTGNYILTSGTWALNNAIANTTPSNLHSTPRGLQLKSTVGASATSPIITAGGLGTISFWVCSTSAGGAINVSWQINGGGFNAGTSYTGLTTSPVLYTLTVNDANANIQFKFTRTAGTVVLDDVSTTSYSSAPSLAITLSPTTLTGFSYVFGSGPSANQTFTASGVNLTTDITLTPPTNYEISTSSGSGFGSTITLTPASGTVSSTTIYVRLKSGLPIGNYNSESVSATSTGAFTKNVVCSGSVVNASLLQPGDIAILAFNTDNLGAGTGSDEVSFVTFVDIVPGTIIDITDNAYQKCGTTNGWGISEGWIRIKRANTSLPKGTIVTVRVAPSGGAPSVFSPDPSNWVCTKPQPAGQGNFDLNNGGEQIFFLTGGEVGGPNAVTATVDSGTYSGSFLYGFNTKGNIWSPVCGEAIAGGTKNSDKPVNFDCFLVWPTVQADLNKYSGPMTPATQRDWLARIDNPMNWSGYVDNAHYDAGPNFYGGTITINTGGYSAGVWIGDKDANWFECSNWQSRKVPDSTVNVTVGSNASQGVTVDATATNASFYNFIAQCKDISISNYNIKVEGNGNNILEVYGNLTLSDTGLIDMDDSNVGTGDGKIKLYGNWTNSVGVNAFQEGNGTVYLEGSLPQVINGNNHTNPEEFYNIVLDNNFDTFSNNNIIAKGNLDISIGNTLNIASNDYVEVSYKVTNNGALNIANNGSLVQLKDTYPTSGLPVIDSGTISMQRTPTILRSTDYIYWSSPVSNFPVANISPSSGLIYKWIPTIDRAYTSNFGGWAAANSDIMLPGKGYIVRGLGTGLATFTNNASNGSGTINNGVINVGIECSGYDGSDYTYVSGTKTLTVNKDNDNYNLLGNPYASSIDADTFLTVNTNIEGHVRLWSHGTAISASNGQSFYNAFVLTYTASDYIFWNKLGLSSGPQSFNGKIASGQGFFVTMNNSSVPASENITFNNSMRSKNHNNSNFFRLSNASKSNRIWLDVIDDTNNSVRTLIGYDKEATYKKDRMFDAKINLDSNLNIFSLIDTEPQIIQGRPIPFDKNDCVPIGVSIPLKAGNTTATFGTYKIAIAFVDGLFQNKNQEIYLEDKLLNIIHDLRKEPYSFSSVAGRFDNRFVLRYTNTKSLGTTHFKDFSSSIVLASNDGQVKIISNTEAIKKVMVYDILGREIFAKNNINAMELSIKDIILNRQALVVKIVLENGQEISKKIIL